MSTAKIKLSNGLQFEAEDCGGSFAVDKKPDFPTGIFGAEISGEGRKDKFDQCRLVECYSADGRYWFNFAPLSDIERRMIELEDALCEISRG
jgi:hypothetical protein